MQIIDELIKPYSIEKDAYSYNVVEDTSRTNKDGEPILKLHGYYSSVESALNAITKLKVETKTVYTIKEYVAKIVETKSNLIKP